MWLFGKSKNKEETAKDNNNYPDPTKRPSIDNAMQSVFHTFFKEYLAEMKIPVMDNDFALGKTSDFYDAIRRDPHVSTVWGNRKSALTAAKWKIIGEGKRDARAASVVTEIIEDIPEWYEVIEFIMEAIFQGVSFQEIIWEKTGVIRKIKEISHVDKDRFTWVRDLGWHYRGDNKAAVPGDPIYNIKNKFIFAGRKKDLDNPYGRPLSASIYWAWKFKNTAIMFWLKYIELFGNPWKIIKCETSDLVTEMKTLMKSIQNSPDIYLVPGVEFDMREPGGTGFQIFKEFVNEYCNPEITKAVLGQTLTTEIGQTGGAYAAAKVHDGIRIDYQLGDRNFVEDVINRQIIKPILNMNFPFQDIRCKFMFDFEEKEDLNNRWTRDKEMLEVIPIAEEYYYETYQIPRPTPEQTLAKSQADNEGGFGRTPSDTFQRSDEKLAENIRDDAVDISAKKLLKLLIQGKTPKEIRRRLIEKRNTIVNQAGSEMLKTSAIGNVIGQESARKTIKTTLNKIKKNNVDFAFGLDENEGINLPEYNLASQEAIDYWSDQEGGFNLYEYYQEQGKKDSENMVDTLIEVIDKEIKDGTDKEIAIEKIKMAGLTSAKTAHRTNLARAYQQGRRQELDEFPDAFPAFVFRTATDVRTRGKITPKTKSGKQQLKKRGDHYEMEGVVLLRDDPYMQRGETPPLDYNCRCRLEPVPVYDMDDSWVKEGIKKGKSQAIRNNLKKFPFWNGRK